MATIRTAACSDPPSPEAQARWAVVEHWLTDQGESVAPVQEGPELWTQDEWWLVADPTGGSRAKDNLESLMEGLPTGQAPAAHRRAWWSMSDNCLVLNALIDRGQCRLFHGHPLTLAGRNLEGQRQRFAVWCQALRTGQPFPAETMPPVEILRGSWSDEITLVGGNLGAMERLGDTPWRPRSRGRRLLLESLSCPSDAAARKVAALVADPWWEDIEGLILGRFTAADKEDAGWLDRCLTLLPPDLPVARWPLVGHGSDGWTIPLAEPLRLAQAHHV